LNLFQDLQGELGVAYLFICHDLAVVEHIAHEVIVMYLGRVMEQGTKDMIFLSPRHPYTQTLLASTPKLKQAKGHVAAGKGELPSPLNPPKGCVFSSRCPLVFARCHTEAPMLRDVGGGHRAACHLLDGKA
jgi:oligopeptide/dipeptide ABC transporter ATP-binding protein